MNAEEISSDFMNSFEEAYEIYKQYITRNKEVEQAMKTLGIVYCADCSNWHPIKGMWSAEDGQLGHCDLFDSNTTEGMYCSCSIPVQLITKFDLD